MGRPRPTCPLSAPQVYSNQVWFWKKNAVQIWAHFSSRLQVVMNMQWFPGQNQVGGAYHLGSHSPQAQTAPPLWQALQSPAHKHNSCELLTHKDPFIHQNRLILVVDTAYLSSFSCLCENNAHMCYVWTHELAQMHQILMKQQINPCTLPAAGQFWLHLWCRNRWRQCCRHAQPGGADCFGTCPSSWCAGISGGQVPPLPIKKMFWFNCECILPPPSPSVWSFVF